MSTRVQPEPADFEDYSSPRELVRWTRRFAVRLEKPHGQMTASCLACGDGFLSHSSEVLRYMRIHACEKGAVVCAHEWRYAGHVGPGSERSLCMKCGQTLVVT